jgi:hypothetical protein
MGRSGSQWTKSSGQQRSWRKRSDFGHSFIHPVAPSSSYFHNAHPRKTQSTMADTEQPEAPDYVTLVSNDGFEFVVQRKSACLSGAIKRMLDPNSVFNQFFSSPLLTANNLSQMALLNQRLTSVPSRTSTVWCSRRCANTSTITRRIVTLLVSLISTFRLSSVLSCSWRLTI